MVFGSNFGAGLSLEEDGNYNMTTIPAMRFLSKANEVYLAEIVISLDHL